MSPCVLHKRNLELAKHSNFNFNILFGDIVINFAKYSEYAANSAVQKEVFHDN